MVGVDRLTGELAGEIRHARVPVVPIGNHQEVEQPRLPVLRLQFPAPGVQTPGMLDAVLELDVVLEVERLGIVLEIRLDLRVVRKVRVVLRHREVTERQPVFRSVDVQRAVSATVPVGVSERPIAADPVGHLEARVRHAVVGQHLAGGQTADSGADDGGGGSWHSGS